jgi:hypothetical protein
MAKATPKKEVAEKKVEAPKVEEKKAEAPKVEAPKVEVPKVEAPKVETPKEKESEPETKVRVLKDFFNVYIAGKRYTGKAGEVVSLPKSVVFILRQDGSVI